MLLHGENVKLRALEPTDLELIYTWENNPKVWMVSHTITPFSRFVVRQYLESQHQDIYTIKQLRLVVENQEGVAVGLIDLFDFDAKHRRAGLGILIEEKHRGKGYAKESVKLMLEYSYDHLDLHQVFVNIGEHNKVSVDLFQSFGFEKVGVKKDWIKTAKGFENELLFQKIKD